MGCGAPEASIGAALGASCAPTARAPPSRSTVATRVDRRTSRSPSPDPEVRREKRSPSVPRGSRKTEALRREYLPPPCLGGADPVAEQMPLWAEYAAASIPGLVASAPRAGHPVRRLHLPVVHLDHTAAHCRAAVTGAGLPRQRALGLAVLAPARAERSSGLPFLCASDAMLRGGRSPRRRSV